MIVLSGASASGKTEVAKLLAKKYGITKVVTTTTRDMRIGEVDGRDYFFVDKEKFEDMLREDLFVEHTLYNGNSYGSTKDQIADNKCIVADLAGLRSYIALGDKKIISFFLDASEEKRHQRMLERGDDLEKIASRIAHDRKAFKKSLIPKVDFHIDSQDTTVEQVADQIYQLYIEELKRRGC